MIKKLISQNIIAREMLVYLRSRLSLMYFADMTLAIINTRQELFDLIDEGIAALNKIENKTIFKLKKTLKYKEKLEKENKNEKRINTNY